MNPTRRDLLRWTSLSLAAAWPSARLLGQAPAPQQAPRRRRRRVRRRAPQRRASSPARAAPSAPASSTGGLVVVDTQFPDTAQICLDGLKTRGGGRGDRLVINTHHHGDHTGGNGVFGGARQEDRRARQGARADEGPRRARPERAAADTSRHDVPGHFKADLGDEVVSAQVLRPGAHRRRHRRPLREGQRRPHGRPDVQPAPAVHRPAGRRVDAGLDHAARAGVESARRRHDVHLRPRRRRVEGDRRQGRPAGAARLLHGAARVSCAARSGGQAREDDHQDATRC